jgi:alkylated DNA repair dioxygenase AlkB
MTPIETAPEAWLSLDLLSPVEATALFEALLSEVSWDERMKARKTACFGQTYDDSVVDYEVVPMHPLLVPLCELIEKRLPFRPTNCLLNFYENGRSSMGFHSDVTHNLAEGTGVAIVSLGAARSSTFRSKSDESLQVSYPLPHGSLFYMSQMTQDFWTHAVKTSDANDARISLTFRHILSPSELSSKAVRFGTAG